MTQRDAGVVEGGAGAGGGDVLAVARTVASVDFPPLAASPVDRLGFGGGETVAAANLVN